MMSSQNDSGFSFSFELPSEGLALRAVAIENDIPKLIFDARMKVPTLTEEDVGIACQLACDEQRPEFFYVHIPPDHPFYGRQYKHYCPQKLRNTSIGELLAEVDWTMKCLNIGARSDKTREEFWAWKERSNLEGLADRLDFPIDKQPGSVMMSCDSVKVETNENEMMFLEEPKMRITDDMSSTYTNYITEIYPSIAYYDEPLFLKMQEVIKLIVAVEWLKEKGVRFSRPWMTACLTQKRQEVPQAIEVKPKGLGKAEVKDIASNVIKQLPESSHEEMMSVLGPLSVDTVVEKNITESSFEVRLTKTVVPTSLDTPKVEDTTVVRASVNDYNMLYSGLDPKMPIIPHIPGQCEEIIPDVQSWSELFNETVPWPQTWKLPYNGEEIFSASGGVSTSKIPVVETVADCRHRRVHDEEAVKENVKSASSDVYQKRSTNEQLVVAAKRGKAKKAKRVSKDKVPSQPVVSPPVRNVTSMTEQTRRNRSQKNVEGFGFTDTGGGQMVISNSSGENISKARSMRMSVEKETSINGKQVGKEAYGKAMAPLTTVLEIGEKYKQPGQHEENNNCSGKRVSSPPTVQPLLLRQQQVAQSAGATNHPFSPTGSVASNDSGFVSNPPSLQSLPLGQQQVAQPAGATNHPFSPTGSVASNDSGFVSNPPTLQPLPLGQQQVAQPAGVTNDLFSPTNSVASNDSGFSDSQLNLHHHGHQYQQQQVQEVVEHSKCKPPDDEDDNSSNDSGHDSQGDEN